MPARTAVQTPHPSSADIADLYERHALSWIQDRAGAPFFERGWLDRFKAAVPPGLPVLDIGCGAGWPMAHHLAEAGFEVTGIDSSPSLIETCARQIPRGHWLVADMRTLDLGTTFGGLLAWDSFFHLSPDDQRAMFAVFGMHAESGAALMFTSGPAHGEAIGSFQGDTLYHASLDAEEYERLLASQGFRVLDHMVEDPACGGHTVWLAKRS